MTELLAWASERPLFMVNDAQRALGMKRASLRMTGMGIAQS